MSEHEFLNDRRIWGDATEVGVPVSCYVRVEGRITIGEVVAWFGEHHPQVDVDGVSVHLSGALHWSEPATVADVTQREDHVARKRAQTEKWERETLVRLTEKYGPLNGGAS